MIPPYILQQQPENVKHWQELVGEQIDPHTLQNYWVVSIEVEHMRNMVGLSKLQHTCPKEMHM